MDDPVFAFGSFRLHPREWLLLEDGKPLRLGSRALEILITLVERAGETVPKDQLIGCVRPDTVVVESALRVHVATLRRALGDGRDGNRFIVNIPGRGYSFVAPVRREQRLEAAAPPSRPALRGNLPAQVTRVIGRSDIIATTVSRLSQHRLLTIIGPGGIGKTTVALAAAEATGAFCPDGVWFVELSTIIDAALVPSAVGATLGISPSNIDPLAALVAWLRDKHLLIVLDCCEHVVSGVAAIAEAMLCGAPGVCMLATSREPLRAEGEWRRRLPSLKVPPASSPLSATDALGFSAVELFNERATATAEGFMLSDDQVPDVLEICRRLDGMPLALELAAAQIDALGVKGLAARLEDRFRLLTRGRRTALPRHQTLRATLDWSYGLLRDDEQQFFRALGIFAGGFTVDAAAVVVLDAVKTPGDAIDRLADLVAKSLVVADVSDARPRFRLLDTTRAYAIKNLDESGESERIARRHAKYYRNLFERAEGEALVRPAGEWLADYAREIDNLRAALDWAFSSCGDASIGVALTAAAAPVWVQLSLLEECRGRVERALAAFGSGVGQKARQEMQLCAALGGSLQFTQGRMVEIDLAWTRALNLAERLADREYQLRALWGLWVHRSYSGEIGSSLRLAQRFHNLALAQGDPTDLAIADRMIGVSLHYRGDQTDARRHIESMLAHYVAPIRRSPSARFVFDQRAIAQLALARILWVQGFPDRAWSIAQSNLENALALNEPIGLCFVLKEAVCPIALFIGDLVAAKRYVATLLDCAAAHDLSIWQYWGHCLQGTFLIWNGDIDTGLHLLLSSLEQPPETDSQLRFTWFLGQSAEGFRRAGRIAEGIVRINEVLARCEHNEDRWCMAELLRIKADLMVQSEATAAAEDLFRQALDLARRQGALSWELRAAISLARLLRDQDRTVDAIACLQPIYDRFTEGFGTADLKDAKTLLEELA